jgi:hypothetical protein
MVDPPESFLRLVEVESVSGDPLPVEVTIEAKAEGIAGKDRRP